MKKEKTEKVKETKRTLSAFTIILILLVVMAVVTRFLPTAEFIEVGEELQIVNGTGVTAATFKDVLLASIQGFGDAADVGIFVLVLGGFLAIVNATGALEMGVKVLVKKLKGRELILIPILMFVFSIMGTTYGFLEESVPFYALLSFTMLAAGMDTLVASATVLLGAGCGVIGSTINPFATGAAIAAANDAGLTINNGLVMLIGVVLWLVTLIISVVFVMSYAKRVKEEKGSTFLCLQEQELTEERYARNRHREVVKLTGSQKATLILFALTFVVMVLGFIPWVDLGVLDAEIADAGTHWSAFLTGNCFGYWWFEDAAAWFFLMSIVIGLVNRMKEKELVDKFLSGASEILSVVLVIAVARGVTLLMKATYLDNYILYNAADALKNTSSILFTNLNYLLHLGLSFLVPSSSGLAALSTPIIAPLSNMLGYRPEVALMGLVSANGVVNLITPTCGAIMGGLALAGVNYSTWVKWSIKLIVILAVSVAVILSLFAII